MNAGDQETSKEGIFTYINDIRHTCAEDDKRNLEVLKEFDDGIAVVAQAHLRVRLIQHLSEGLTGEALLLDALIRTI
jgi:hypothetical protein